MTTSTTPRMAAPHTSLSLSGLSVSNGPDPRRAKPRLGERLVSAGLLTSAELEAALGQQSKGVRIGEALVKLGFIEESDLLPFLADQLGLPHVHLREGLIDPLAARLIPRMLAESCVCLALFRVRGTLTVAMADPQNLDDIDRLERHTALKIRPVLGLRSVLLDVIPRVYGEGFQVEMLTAEMEHGAVAIGDEALHLDLEDILTTGESSPVINLVNYMILQAVRQRASDIHVEAGPQHSIVRFRVDGMLREVLRPKREFHPAIISRLKVMAKMDIAEHRLPQDGRIHVVVDQRQIDLRASTLPTVLGEKAVLRVLDRANVTFRLDELGIPEGELDVLRQLVSRPNGMLLVTGPTGSGKTTTLYSLVESIKSVERNIVTVEDPVEYRLDLINQVHANQATSLTFAKALRAILRQDPDVIMIGEIRDVETAETAIQAALTGHLVLSTLHTNDSASAITRLVDMGVAPFKIGAAMLGVIAQRLARRICPHCQAGYYPSSTLLDTLRYAGDRNRQFVRGSGCERCYDSGFRGRVGIYEFLHVTRDIRDLISRNAPVDQLRDLVRKNGGGFLLEHGLQLAEQGVTSLEEVLRVAMSD